MNNPMNQLKKSFKRKESYHSYKSTMSTKTKDFIQKICSKKPASVDMTKHGFINDNKMYAVNLLLRPLRDKLEKIYGKQKHTEDAKEAPIKSSSKKKYATWRKVSKAPVSGDHAKIKRKAKKVATSKHTIESSR